MASIESKTERLGQTLKEIGRERTVIPTTSNNPSMYHDNVSENDEEPEDFATSDVLRDSEEASCPSSTGTNEEANEEESDDEIAPAAAFENNEVDDCELLADLAVDHNVNNSQEAIRPTLDLMDHAMIEIYQYALKEGTSLQFIDGVMSLIKKHTANGFDVTKTRRRKTFMRNLRDKMGVMAPPIPKSVEITKINAFVPCFSILDQIMDLIASADFQNLDNLVVNDDPTALFGKFDTPDGSSLLEVNSGRWYSDTYDQLIKDPATEWLFPLILYVDKTGTDALQRFPLEPLMFTTSNLKREVRERASSWRHLGFVPPYDNAGAKPQQTMQAFHDCLEVLLEELLQLQETPPTIDFILDGIVTTKKLILPVAFVMGDQLSQDKLCGRKAANSGGAGRIHRRCMCSALSASSTCSPCTPVSKQEIEQLVNIVLCESDPTDTYLTDMLPNGASVVQKRKLCYHLKRRSKCARRILEKVYSTYPINNAWSKVCFGANKEGIFRATLDDPMHYCDSGSFLYLAQVAFLSMTDGERLEMERIIKILFKSIRSSVREDLPRGKFSSGFSRTTLMTAGEKIGLILSLLVTLGTETGSSLFSKVIGRIQEKYESLPPSQSSGGHQLPQRGDVYFFKEFNAKKKDEENAMRIPRTREGVAELVTNMSRHELSFVLAGKRFDELQSEYLLFAVGSSLVVGGSSIQRQFPHISIPNVHAMRREFSKGDTTSTNMIFRVLRKEPPVYHDTDGSAVDDDNDSSDDDNEQVISNSHKDAPEDGPCKKKRKLYEVKKEIKKHGLVKPKVNGQGPTSAILTDIQGFRDLLIKALNFHSFIHYFEQIETEDRTKVDLITKHVRGFVNAFARIVYRGDDSVDCDTSKIHSHLHLPEDIQDYGHPMNWEAGKGERGLKVWAKLASATAQKFTIPIFTHQTALRVADAMLLSKAAAMLESSAKIQEAGDEVPEETAVDDTTTVPHHQDDNIAPVVGGMSNKNNEDDVVCTIKVRKEAHFLVDLTLNPVAVKEMTRRGKLLREPDMDFFDPLVIDALRKSEQGTTNEIKVYKDARVFFKRRGKQIIRACSSYDRFGAFFDWVSVNWPAGRGNKKASAPAKLHMLYEDANREMCAIVHSCGWQDRDDLLDSTSLTERWKVEVALTDHQQEVTRVLRKIKLRDIVDVLYVVEHEGESPSVDVVQPRYVWATNFFDKDKKQNKKERSKRG
jgi:hypothetical protein